MAYKVLRYSRALNLILSKTNPIKDAELIEIRDAMDRVLAEDIVAKMDIPPYDRAAMDGFAVRAEDTLGASTENPISLKIIGESEIGKPFPGEVNRGEAVRISTGAVIPKGADAVIRIEDCEEEDGKVIIFKPVSVGENISFRGEDVKEGEIVLSRGTIIKHFDIAMLKALGIKRIRVYRRLKVGIFAVGDELVDDLAELKEGKILEYTREIAIGFFKQYGAIVKDYGIIGDDTEEIRNAIESALNENDILVTVGGTSVGKKDFVPRAVEDMGEIIVHRVAVQPGKPFCFGIINNKPVICLPGLPVAAYADLILFVLRILEKMMSLNKPLEYPKARGILKKPIYSRPGWVTVSRVKLIGNYVEPIMIMGSGVLSTVVKADGLVIVPEDAEGFDVGREVDVILTRWVAYV